MMNSQYPAGSKRAKIAGYLQVANQLRQDYQAKRVGAEEYPTVSDPSPGVKISRHGDDEIVLFPSYARSHISRNHQPISTDNYSEGGDAEYWKREWEIHEDKNAIIDVDTRGWIYLNSKGPLYRKNRLILTVARQLSGVPAPESKSESAQSSLAEPGSSSTRQENDLAMIEAAKIERRGLKESKAAEQGDYSVPTKGVFDVMERSESHDPSILRLQDASDKRSTWSDPSEFTPEELERANKNLLLRLRPFLASPSINTPVTLFYYNNTTSQSRTTMTNENGHFNFRAALNFVPTHVRVLAGEGLSITEEVQLTESKGVSLISDIDDTVKYSAISAGAREIFRNTFVRELEDLTIDGVREWYRHMYDKGLKLHYVSNSPWQLYPLLAEYFITAGLPPGSFHLKHYTGMLQGIFEPAAERKKGSLDRIMYDFPDRKFILVGDSGEADLEVYTDVALTHPKRVIAIFIRDVTTPLKQNLDFFNSTRSTDAFPRHGALGKSTNDTYSKTAKPPPPLPPRPSVAPLYEEDLIDLNDDFIVEPPARSSTEPIKPTSSATFSSHAQLSATTSVSIKRKPPPPPPPKPRQLLSGPTKVTKPSAYTDAVKNKVVSAYNSIPSTGISSIISNRSSSPAPSSHFGRGNLTFVGDEDLTNDRPAPALASRSGGSGTGTYPEVSSAYKKEEIWKRRWLRAKELLEAKGVILKAWRTGNDVAEDVSKLVERTKKL